MTETSTVKTLSEKVRDAEVALTKAEQEVVKARLVLREERINALKSQIKDTGTEVEISHINLTLAVLENSDAERDGTRTQQRIAATSQNVNYCQRQHAVALKNSRTINVNQVA